MFKKNDFIIFLISSFIFLSCSKEQTISFKILDEMASNTKLYFDNKINQDNSNDTSFYLKSLNNAKNDVEETKKYIKEIISKNKNENLKNLLLNNPLNIKKNSKNYYYIYGMDIKNACYPNEGMTPLSDNFEINGFKFIKGESYWWFVYFNNKIIYKNIENYNMWSTAGKFDEKNNFLYFDSGTYVIRGLDIYKLEDINSKPIKFSYLSGVLSYDNNPYI
jgi:hypothetical protein